MSYLEELLPEFRNGAKIRKKEWDERIYLYYKDGLVYDRNNRVMYRFSTKALSYDGWEIYQEPIDWGYIIKNKCLCWFWDDGKESVKDLDFLESKGNRFLDVHGFRWDNCRPVRKDEVTFYDERDD